ncbi:MAG TPA: DUF3303 family protein [Blastocatellia bacterium]|nr:DUF3303 family protein [Blastocatellia bacterium]
MLFMVIERFKPGKAEEVYRRYREQGRMLPAGLRYVDSWIETNLSRCFQLMEADDAGLFDQWIAHWQDLVDFEILPVIKSGEAAERMTQLPK